MTKNILLIDDDVLVRKGLATGLADAGYAVSEASNGKEGLTQAIDSHPDIIISDIRMPEMDGLSMIDELRKDEWGANVPVIVMSTDDTATSLNKALAEGVTVYLSKDTLTPDLLLEQITQILG